MREYVRVADKIDFNDSPQAQYLSPALTCFRVSLTELGRRLGETLISAMDKTAAPRQTLWPMEMVVGESDKVRPRGVRQGSARAAPKTTVI